ncbi:MAG: hypothetical protein AAB365_01975 [Patescibacteria group bacterium]
MSRHISPDTEARVRNLMFGSFTAESPTEHMLMEELTRYIPQLASRTPAEIAGWMEYHRRVYLQGTMPTIGRPMASLNPSFVGSIASLPFSLPDGRVYTRGSVKENGYRLQLHVGTVSELGFTRQFSQYDWRMMPELPKLTKVLPIMIGDTELINAKYRHLAGFNRVQVRLPANPRLWPRPGEGLIDDDALKAHLAELDNVGVMKWGIPLPDHTLTLAFHGLFAIAHPKTWGLPRQQQLDRMITLCHLPINYQLVDELLDELQAFLNQKELPLRTVERTPLSNQHQLEAYIEEKERQGHEGVCIVQSGWDGNGRRVSMGRSTKVKAYETFDAKLMGLYLADKKAGCTADNITGALVGLYDVSLGAYLPVTKVNLDPNGPQIKLDEQRKRLIDLRRHIIAVAVKDRAQFGKVLTLHDAFIMQGAKKLGYLSPAFAAIKHQITAMLDDIPRGADLVSLYEEYKTSPPDLTKKASTKGTARSKFIALYAPIFGIIARLDKRSEKTFLDYFSKSKAIKATSAKMKQPDILIGGDPVIIEIQTFDIKWGVSPYPAGFHSWYAQSFCFSNSYPERLRLDKSITTDYETVFVFARKYTVKKPKRTTKKK